MNISLPEFPCFGFDAEPGDNIKAMCKGEVLDFCRVCLMEGKSLFVDRDCTWEKIDSITYKMNVCPEDPVILPIGDGGYSPPSECDLASDFCYYTDNWYHHQDGVHIKITEKRLSLPKGKRIWSFDQKDCDYKIETFCRDKISDVPNPDMCTVETLRPYSELLEEESYLTYLPFYFAVTSVSIVGAIVIARYTFAPILAPIFAPMAALGLAPPLMALPLVVPGPIPILPPNIPH